MSHDQKPARVRVVRNAASPPRRRRNDPPLSAIVIDGDAINGDAIDGDAIPQSAALAPDAVAVPGAGAARGTVIGVALFLIGSIGASVAVTMLGRP